MLLQQTETGVLKWPVVKKAYTCVSFLNALSYLSRKAYLCKVLLVLGTLSKVTEHLDQVTQKDPGSHWRTWWATDSCQETKTKAA